MNIVVGVISKPRLYLFERRFYEIRASRYLLKIHLHVCSLFYSTNSFIACLMVGKFDHLNLDP